MVFPHLKVTSPVGPLYVAALWVFDRNIGNPLKKHRAFFAHRLGKRGFRRSGLTGRDRRRLSTASRKKNNNADQN